MPPLGRIAEGRGDLRRPGDRPDLGAFLSSLGQAYRARYERLENPRDLSRAIRVSEALRFAIVGINDINPTSAAAPFGGTKESGLGREGGREGITEYLDTKLVGLSV